MKHLRIMGLSLVAVFAIAAVAATSASALPEWGRCEAKAGGKYSDSNCTKKAKLGTGTFEFKKGSTLKNVKFNGTQRWRRWRSDHGTQVLPGGKRSNRRSARIPNSKCTRRRGRNELLRSVSSTSNAKASTTPANNPAPTKFRTSRSSSSDASCSDRLRARTARSKAKSRSTR